MSATEPRTTGQLCADALSSAALLQKIRNGAIDHAGKLQIRSAALTLEELVEAITRLQEAEETSHGDTSSLLEQIAELKLLGVRREAEMAKRNREISALRESNAALRRSESGLRQQLERASEVWDQKKRREERVEGGAIATAKRDLARSRCCAMLAFTLVKTSPSRAAKWELHSRLYSWRCGSLQQCRDGVRCVRPTLSTVRHELASPVSTLSPGSPMLSPIRTPGRHQAGSPGSAALAARALYAKKKAMLTKFQRRIDSFLNSTAHRSLRSCVQRFRRNHLESCHLLELRGNRDTHTQELGTAMLTLSLRSVSNT